MLVILIYFLCSYLFLFSSYIVYTYNFLCSLLSLLYSYPVPPPLFLRNITVSIFYLICWYIYYIDFDSLINFFVYHLIYLFGFSLSNHSSIHSYLYSSSSEILSFIIHFPIYSFLPSPNYLSFLHFLISNLPISFIWFVFIIFILYLLVYLSISLFIYLLINLLIYLSIRLIFY